LDKVQFTRQEVVSLHLKLDRIGLPSAPHGGFSYDRHRRRKDGKRLPFPIRTRDRALELFYRVPGHYRSKCQIPGWFPDQIGVPKYLFRIKGEKLSLKQTTISVICRLYYLYRFRLDISAKTVSYRRKLCRSDSLGYLIRGCTHSRNWALYSSIALRRLKVLLCPILGPSTGSTCE